MNLRKFFISGVLCTTILAGSTMGVSALSSTYTVQAGDTYWIISQKLGVPILTLMAANNATQNTILYVGQSIVVPTATQTTQPTTYTVQKGDTYWIVSQKFGVDINQLLALNGANANSYLYIGQQIKIPAPSTGTTTTAPQPTTSSGPYITYKSYTVQKGDILWNLAIKFGIPLSELLKANNLTETSSLTIGQVLKIPVHNVPVKSTPGPQYGEALDWWTEAQYVVPVGANFEVVDFKTGKSFYARRTTGANHSDTETLTLDDTNKMKEIWSGSFSWTARPVLIKINGRTIAASMSGMPHAGNDAAAAGVWTSWRSDNYGPGTNFDWIKNNGMDGHFDIHFLNSTRHVDGQIDPTHQANVKIAAGIN
ncbi:MAG: LysM peptidoglycan-binding domain-containing protein [Caulobacteraceae bacterium]